MNIVSLSFAQEKQLELVKVNSANFSLSAANGGFLSVEFTTEIDLELPNSDHVQKVSLLVSPDLQSQDIIIGWLQMVNWNLLQLDNFSNLPQSVSNLQL